MIPWRYVYKNKKWIANNKTIVEAPSSKFRANVLEVLKEKDIFGDLVQLNISQALNI